jgi:hypothetical protein
VVAAYISLGGSFKDIGVTETSGRFYTPRNDGVAIAHAKAFHDRRRAELKLRSGTAGADLSESDFGRNASANSISMRFRPSD